MIERVWIELEKSDDQEENKKRGSETHEPIFWNERANRYCYADQAGTYKELADNGHWFNLEFFGRPL